MKYRLLGKTGLLVSEIGFGGEWLERHPHEEAVRLIRLAHEKGINIIDCWMPDPKSRDIIGEGISGCREEWFVQGHLGSTWKDGQYYRTRDLAYVKPAFEDLLARMRTDYMDLGMIHFVDSEQEWEEIQTSGYLQYILELKAKGSVRHIGMSTHNPQVALRAAQTDYIEMILFSLNPAFDMLASSDHFIDDYLADRLESDWSGIMPERVALYQACREHNIGITVMKGFAGGRLFSEKDSPLGVALTPVQCLQYALTRPAVASVLVGYDTPEQIDAAVAFENASDEEKDFAPALGRAKALSVSGKCMYCNHCKPCPVNIDIAMVNKLYDLAVMQPDVPATLRAHYRELPHNADECVGCGACEARCPFSVKIVERMEKARELFA